MGMRGNIISMIVFQDYVIVAFDNRELWHYHPGNFPSESKWIRVNCPYTAS